MIHRTWERSTGCASRRGTARAHRSGSGPAAESVAHAIGRALGHKGAAAQPSCGGKAPPGRSAEDGQPPANLQCCYLVPRAYPAFRKIDAAQVGYVWGVYMCPEHRGRRVGEALVLACMSHLKSIGCGRVLLHAGERSAPLYRRMGFEPTDELSATLLWPLSMCDGSSRSW